MDQEYEIEYDRMSKIKYGKIRKNEQEKINFKNEEYKNDYKHIDYIEKNDKVWKL